MIGTDKRGAVTVLRIERHAQRNALDTAHARALLEAATEAVDAGARCLVITGEGSSFCAGGDLDQVHSEGFVGSLGALLRGIVALPVPVIAAVNGPAIGAGTQLAIVCDLRVGAPTARFAVPTVRLGLALDTFSVQRLTALVGGAAARALLIGADTFDVERAHTVGLVDRLGDLDDALAWAEEIAALAPLTMRYNKLALDQMGAHGDGSAPVPQQVQTAFEAVWASDDALEGLRARAERRAPRFEGR